MLIKEFFKETPENKEHFITEMSKCDWDAGRYLAYMLKDNSFKKNCGENSEVLLLTDGENLASFCTYVDMDEIDDDSMKPWAGFVYTFPEHRGKRCAGKLLEYAKNLAKNDGYLKLYVSSEEKGLYEKYGFTYLKDAESIHGYETQIFYCNL